MSPRGRKTVLRIHASPGKVRRVWAIKPKTRVHASTRKDKLRRIREREARESQ
jgi:hypothetical protein